jgi:hypothetical protein
MDWYYDLAGNNNGPVDTAELNRLAAQGVVTAETLVWHEGMAGWEPYARAVGAAAPPVTASASVSQPSAVQQAFASAPKKADPESIRRSLIGHESSIRSIGILYYLGALLLSFGAIAAFFFLATRIGVGSTELSVITAMLALAGLELWVGFAIRRLKPWSRIAAGVLSVIGLFGFPIGTLINGYILYLLFSKKGSTVYSEDYQTIIAQTPQVRYRTSIVVWVLVGLLVAAVSFIVIGAISASHNGPRRMAPSMRSR